MRPSQELPYVDPRNLFSGFEHSTTSSGLCHECQSFVQSLFPANEQKFTKRWSIVNRQQSIQHNPRLRLWTYDLPLKGQHISLQNFSANACELCSLLLLTWKQVREQGSTASTYQIAARDGWYFKFYMCFCEPSSISDDDLDVFDHQGLKICEFHIFRRIGSVSDFRFFKALSEAGHEVFPELTDAHVEANLHCDSEEAIDRARTWFRNCKQHHSKCRRLPATLPKRVLDLARPASRDGVFLSEINGAVSEYAT